MTATPPNLVLSENTQNQRQGHETFSGGVLEHMWVPPEGLWLSSWHQPLNNTPVLGLASTPWFPSLSPMAIHPFCVDSAVAGQHASLLRW